MKIEQENLYPILFYPYYKEVIWGGEKIKSHYQRELPNTKLPVGESWEISDRPDVSSVVENGPLKDKTIKELIDKYDFSLLGSKCHQKKFPLLIKIIDAGERLSLQVHPDKNAASKIPGAEPKTEMWYVIDADKDAKIFVGLNNKATKRTFIESCQSSDIEKYLQTFKSQKGDAFFILAGTIHAIGEGNLIFEVQQNSDTTYRISDWGRLGSDGKSRELHINEAISSIDFIQRTNPKISGVTNIVEHNRKFPVIKDCPLFKVDDLRLTSKWDDKTTDSFHVLTAVTESIEIMHNNKKTQIPRGRSCLLPACFGDYSILVNDGHETIVLKTYI